MKGEYDTSLTDRLAGRAISDLGFGYQEYNADDDQDNTQGKYRNLPFHTAASFYRGLKYGGLIMICSYTHFVKKFIRNSKSTYEQD
jgi:hypothetical protein